VSTKIGGRKPRVTVFAGARPCVDDDEAI